MKKVLCPTDFSETAHNAIAYAAKFAQATGSQLTLYNVQSMFNLSPIEIVRSKMHTIQTVTQQLEEQSREVSQMFKISCYAEVEPTTKLLSKVIEHKSDDFDLIIMGTRGPDDLFKFFAGSNTYNAIMRSNIPVILIPENFVYTPIEVMVYAYDYLVERKLPLVQLVPWLKRLETDLSILEVMEEAHSGGAESDLRQIQKLIRLLYSEVDFSFDTIYANNVAASINNYIIRNRVDMLALCTKNRNFLTRIFHKSVIKSISAQASYPVFVLHE